jgi:hypothetical protein
VTLDEKRSMATDFSIVWSSSEDVAKFKSYFSFPEFVEFPTVIPGQHAYAYFYAPYSDIFQGSSDEKPPLLVRTHGIQLYLFLSFLLELFLMSSCSQHHVTYLGLFEKKMLDCTYKLSVSI